MTLSGASGISESPTHPQFTERTRTPKRRWLVVAKATLSLGLLLVLMTRIELDEVLRSLRGAHTGWIAAAFASYAVGQLIGALRWQVLLRAQGVRVALLYLIRGSLVGAFFSQFLPSTIGGDGVRMYYSWKVTGRKSRAVVVIAMDRLMGILVLAPIALVSAALASDLAQRVPLAFPALGALILGGFGIVALAFAAPERWSEKVRRMRPFRLEGIAGRLLTAFRAFSGKWSALATALLLSMLLQANVILHYAWIGWSLELDVSLGEFVLIVPLALAVMLLPISINGIGLRESAFTFFLGLYGVSVSEAVTFAWISYVGQLLVGISGGLIHAVTTHGSHTWAMSHTEAQVATSDSAS